MKIKAFFPSAALCCLFAFCSAFSHGSPRQTLLERAETYRRNGRFLEALSFYRDILVNSWPGSLSPRLYKGIADIYYGYLGDADQALQLYKKKVELFPDDPDTPAIYRTIARIYYAKGVREEAAFYYRKILSLFPSYYKDFRIKDELERLEGGQALLEDVLLSVDRPLPGRVRVLIAESPRLVAVTSSGALGVFAPESAFFKKQAPGRPIRLSAHDGTLFIDETMPVRGPVRLKSGGGEGVAVNGRPFRGFVWVRAGEQGLQVINHVDLEEYLYGVLPLEVSSAWPAQSLQAQAVAARTYALYHAVMRAKDSYDVFSTTSSQVYGGRAVERPAARQAVDLTKGLVLSYDQKLILTLYHANSGGQTESAESVWGSPLPYLCRVEDLYSRDRPGFQWSVRLSVDEIQNALSRYGLPAGEVINIESVRRSGTGRVERIKITQKEKSFFLSGNSFRLVVGPARVKSTRFRIERKRAHFVFDGSGYGHGVGMSQWGAYSMAKSGHDFRSILGYYYPGTVVSEVRLGSSS